MFAVANASGCSKPKPAKAAPYVMQTGPAEPESACDRPKLYISAFNPKTEKCLTGRWSSCSSCPFCCFLFSEDQMEGVKMEANSGERD